MNLLTDKASNVFDRSLPFSIDYSFFQQYFSCPIVYREGGVRQDRTRKFVLFSSLISIDEPKILIATLLSHKGDYILLLPFPSQEIEVASVTTHCSRVPKQCALRIMFVVTTSHVARLDAACNG